MGRLSCGELLLDNGDQEAPRERQRLGTRNGNQDREGHAFRLVRGDARAHVHHRLPHRWGLLVPGEALHTEACKRSRASSFHLTSATER